MRLHPVILTVLCFTASLSPASATDDLLDRLQDALTIRCLDGAVRTRVSGALDVEYYRLQQPPPGLIFTDRKELFNPRLTLFLDTQLGGHVYGFVQARIDRGFDPDDGTAQMRLDEYALRFTPWDDGRFSLQVGKFATVAGNWVNRHLSWDNPFITAPTPYENLTGIWDIAAPDSPGTLLDWGYVPHGATTAFDDGYSDKILRLPVIWGPSYATGLSVAGRLGVFEYAAEMKNASLSSRPEFWDVDEMNFEHPAFTARLGVRPNEMWRLGVSASSGPYLLPEAAPSLPVGRDIGDYHEQVLAQDVSFEWHHLQLWAEFFEARFEVPHVGHADTFAYCVEAKYKFATQLFGALRWNQQIYDTIPDRRGGNVQWGNDLWRIDAALGCRFTAHSQLKLQYSLQHEENGLREFSSIIAGQFTLRF